MKLTKEQWQKIGGIVITALLAIAAVLGWFFPVSPGGEIGILLREKISIDARDDVLMYNGADQYVYSDDHSTQKLHIDGATGNIDAEGTGNFAGVLTLQSTLALENGETIVNSTNNAITVTPGITTSVLAIETGNLQVGDGTPGLTLNGEDVYVAGTLEVDGATQFDGAADFNSTMAIGGALDMENNAVSNVGAAGTDFAADGGLTLAKGLTVSDGDVVVADDLRVTAQTSITVTDGAAFTATGTYQAIAAAGEVTPTITCTQTDGSVLTLINTGSETINIEDTGNQVLSAAWAAGQYDVLVLWSDGTRWIEVSRSNN